MALPELPRFFNPAVEPGPSLASRSMLDENAELAVQLLRAQGRNFCIVWDETTYFPRYDILHMGSGEDSKPCYVGGANNKALIRVSETLPDKLLKLDLAQVCLSFLVKRA